MKKSVYRVMAVILAAILSFGDCGIAFATELNTAIEMQEVQEEIIDMTDGNVSFEIPPNEQIEETLTITTDVSESMDAVKATTTADKSVSENAYDGRYEGIYYGEQSMDEMIEILSAGRDPHDFFRYSIWTFLRVEDLIYLRDHGLSLDNLFAFLTGDEYYETDEMIDMYIRYMSSHVNALAAEEDNVLATEASATVTFGSDISTSSLGVISAFGSKSHGVMKSIYLNGQTAFCAKYGAACSTGMTYTATSHTALGISDGQYAILKRIYSWYMAAQAINNNTANLAISQAAFWLVLNNNWTGSPEGMASAISPLFTKTILTQATATSLFTGMVGWINNPAEIARYDLIFWSNGTNQYLVTAYYNPPQPKEYSAHVKITKTDAANGLPVYGNATFHIYNADGSDTGATFTKNGNEYISSTITTSVAGSQYYVVETSSPSGYLEHGSKYYFTIDSGDQDAEKVIANSGNNFVNTPSSAHVKITKTDALTGAAVNGTATFKIYDADGNDTGATFSKNGNVYTSSEVFCRSDKNTFSVVETSSPAGYLPHTTRYTFTINKNDHNAEKVIANSGNNFTNKPSSAYVKITKIDAITGEGLQGNATFKIYDADGKDTGATFRKDGNVYTSSVIYCRSAKNTYYVVEEGAPSGYNKDNQRYSFTIASTDDNALKVISNNGKKAFTNQPYYVKVRIPKVDADTLNAIANNASFSVHAAQGNLSVPVTFTKQADGSYVSSEIYYNEKNVGKFYLTETKAPENYYGDWDNEDGDKTAGSDHNKKKYAFTVSLANDRETLDIVNDGKYFTNTEVRGSLSIMKIDKETDSTTAQGDATIEGAVYGLYAKEDIMMPDGSGVKYKKDTLVESLTTDAHGMASVDELYLGKYYLKEITASEGYLVDPTEYEVNILYLGEDVKKVTSARVLPEQVKKQAFSMIKVGSNEDNTELNLLKAGFKVYLISSLSKVKDGSMKADANGNYDASAFLDYDFTNEETALDYSQSTEGEHIPELFTDETGYLISPELAYGNYVVVETTIPDEYEPIKPFIVKVTNDSRSPQTWRAFYDAEFRAKLKVNKKDIETSENVLKKDTEYLIYDLNKEAYVTQWVTYPKKVLYGTKEMPYATDAEGYLITPEALTIGEYLLEEYKAPEGYIKTGFEGHSENGEIVSEPRENIRFTISSEMAYYVDGDTADVIIVADQYNEAAKGSLKLVKTGEYLTGKDKDGFIYEERGIKGAKFNVYAKEDIYEPDGHGAILYEADALVAELTTDEEGLSYLENIPLGTYYVKEVYSGGAWCLNTEIKEFTLSYVDDETPVVFAEVAYKNERQKIEINIEKFDVDGGAPLSGAKFGLYSADYITVYDDEEISVSENDMIIGSAPSYIVAKDELLETVVTGEYGCASFSLDLPNGYYYVKEIEAPKGYVCSNQIYPVDASFKDANETKITFTYEASNEKIKGAIGVAKKDGSDDSFVQRAKLGLYDAEGTLIEEFYTNIDTYYINNLPLGEYTLKELSTPKGYVKAEDITFTLDRDTEVFFIEMIDERPEAQINVEKVDKESGKKLAGAEFTIKRKDTGEVVDTITTSENGIASSKKLPIANYENGEMKDAIVYIVSETKAPEGYQSDFEDTEVTFTYDDETTILYVTWVTAKDSKIPDTPETPDKPKLPQTNDEFPIWLFFLLGFISLQLGMFLFIKELVYKKPTHKALRMFIASVCMITGLMNLSIPLYMQWKGNHEQECIVAEWQEAITDQREDETTKEDTGQTDAEEEIIPIGGMLGMIEIKTLDIAYPVLEGCEAEQLRYTCGHYIGSANIGANGNCVIAGHRGGRYSTFFKYLPNIKLGDTVTVTNDKGQSFDYLVAETYVTEATDMDVVSQEHDELTLITCENHGKQRFIVKCKRA